MNPEITKIIEQYLQNELSQADRLLFEQRLTENDQLLNELLLPAIDRTLGPIHLNDALETVAGEAWNLMIDETQRTIWFTSTKTKNTHS